jgi:4-amino-4-deoxy-L-arabinose transferase-like glycosyltransferase
MHVAIPLPLAAPATEIRWQLRAAALLVGFAALRVGLAANVGLTDTEAYYFSWSRSLELSYYDHPPLIAWIARLTTEHSQGTLAIRMGPVLAGSLFDLLSLLFARSLFSMRAAFFSLIASRVPPLFLFGAWLLNPEALLAPLWLATIMALYAMRDHHERWRPIVLGGLVGVSFLAKYTAVLAIPLAAAWLSIEPSARRWWKRPELYMGALVALGVSAPVWIWNHQHDWPSARLHLVERMGSSSATALLARAGGVLLGQVGVLSPLVAALMVVALAVCWRRALFDSRYRFLLLTSAPVLCFFVFVMARARDPEPHWMAAGYVPAMLSLGGWIDERGTSLGRPMKAFLALSLASALALWVVFIVHWRTTRVLDALPASAYDADSDPVNETLAWPALRALLVGAARAAGPNAVACASHNVVCGGLDATIGLDVPVYCPSPRPTEYDFLGRAVPPEDAPLIFFETDRYPASASERFPDRDCTPEKDVVLWRGTHPMGRYRVHQCSVAHSRVDSIARAVGQVE